MKKRFLLKTMLLLCALVAGSSSVWASPVTITWAISGVETSSTKDEPCNTELTTSSITGGSGTWTASTEGNCYSATDNGTAHFGSGKTKFNGTITLSSSSIPSDATITSITLNGTTNGTYAVSAKVGATSFGTSTTFVNGCSFSGTVVGNAIVLTFSTTANSNVCISEITVTYSTETISVTGVSLPSTAKAFIGKTITLTPTITPSDATNKNVTWESKNTDIATVSDAGEVTGVAEGDAIIEVKTVDGNHTATCTVTVEPYHVDLTSPVAITSWNSLSYGDETEYEVGGITFTTTQCMKNNGFQFKANQGILASPLINTTKGYTVIVTTNSSGTGTLTLQIGSESVSIPSGKSSSYFATTTSTSTSFSLTNSTNKACNIATLTIIPNSAEVQSYGWATYITPAAIQFAANTAYVVTEASVSEGLALEAVTKVPAGTPVLLKGAGTKDITVISSADAPATNLLSVSDGTALASGYYPYVLAKDGEGACFKQWTGAMTTLNGRVVLILDEAVATASPMFSLDGEGTTGISSIENTTIDNVYYDLSGRRVANPTKGVYIVNGKKVIIK